jgi:hypothetical protein
MATHHKSAHYVETIIREAVARVLHSVRSPLAASGHPASATVLHLSHLQQDFLAGYIHGALQRLLEIGELGTDEDVAHATHRLYRRLFGFDNGELEPWHQGVIREGLHHLNRPHVLLGYCTGRNDVLTQLRFGGRRNALADALRHLGSTGDPLFGVG